MRSLTRAVLAAMCAASCTACAGKATQGPIDPNVRPVILTDQSGILLGERPRASLLTANVAPLDAWQTTKKVYAALGIPVTLENAAAHQIGNKDFWKSRSVGPLRMADVVDCGTGITGRKADTYRIYMSLTTIVEGDGTGGTRLHTTLIPFGQDVAGGSADRIPCGTTGVLESVVNESIRNNSVRK
jgi:hypothetical protein